MHIRLGTRGSELARTQSESVAAALRDNGHDVEVVVIRTEGDINMKPLTELGGVGVFAAALRVAMLDGQVDIAVHSYKDLPTATVDGLVIAAVPAREDVRDVLIGAPGGLAELPPGAKIGTGSPRRASQLLAARPDIEIVDIRGNVDTRIGFVTSGRLDAIVLAAAGLRRLGRLAPEHAVLDFWPAPAQGALAVECRADDSEVRAAVGQLEDPDTRFAVQAEREVLASLAAGCAAPIGVRTTLEGDIADLSALVASHDGSQRVTFSACGRRDRDPRELGREVAQGLLQARARHVVDLGASAPSRIANLHE